MANVTVLNGTMDQKEIDQYINLIEKENPTRKVKLWNFPLTAILSI